MCAAGIVLHLGFDLVDNFLRCVDSVGGHVRVVMVGGKGFVGPALHFL